MQENKMSLWDCAGCDAHYVDECDHDICSVEGVEIDEMDYCPEDDECDDCGFNIDECVCDWCEKCGELLSECRCDCEYYEQMICECECGREPNGEDC